MTESSAARALLESDRLYFELGAQVEQLPGATLAHMPGLETVPAGCVVQLGDVFAADDASSWLDAVERKLRHIGAALHRLISGGVGRPWKGSYGSAGTTPAKRSAIWP